MTPHIEAKKGDINPIVLMPGDPLRAKHIAENFLTDVTMVNRVRNMFAYSGKYKDKPISVVGSGMGIPSMGIYSHELYKEYDVDTIIRVGSCGSYQKHIDLFDIILAQGVSTDSNFQNQFCLNGKLAALADFETLLKAYETANDKNKKCYVGNVFCTDIFYNKNSEEWKKYSELGVLAVEMETYALYLTAQKHKKKALSILTVSDTFFSKEMTTPEEREKSFNDMIEIALETCLK